MEWLGLVLAHECRELSIEFQEIMDELVYPMSVRKDLVQPIFDRIFKNLDLLVLPTISVKQPKIISKTLNCGAISFRAMKIEKRIILRLSESLQPLPSLFFGKVLRGNPGRQATKTKSKK